MKITFEIQSLNSDHSHFTQVEFWGSVDKQLVTLGMSLDLWIEAGRPVTLEMEVPLDREARSQ